MKKKNSFFKKVFASMAVAAFLVSGTVISGFATYTHVGTINNFSLSKSDSTSFGCGNLPAGTQLDQTDSYVTIFNNEDFTAGIAYARCSNSSSSWGFGNYYIAKNSPSHYVYHYKNMPGGNSYHYWSNTSGGGFRTNMSIYAYSN